MRWIVLRKAVACHLFGAFAVFVAAAPSAVADGGPISPANAINYVGQSATVCGVVASAKYAAESNGRPTFLNLDKAYPDPLFTAVIWGKDRKAFPYAPESLAGRKICVTGTIRPYSGHAEGMISDPNQIRSVS